MGGAGFGLGACWGAPPAGMPEPDAGCYVVLARHQVEGPVLELLFPAFFQLDTTPRSDRTGLTVRLPRDDQARFAAGWTWKGTGSGAEVGTPGADQGFRLELQHAQQTWDGLLHAWLGDTVAIWRLEGRRVACPPGLVAAG